jgi:3-deoxy-D-arabino-heptulosonate 7-phosphate (DAHP) synthase
MNPVRIIAGPCSIDKENIKEIYEIAEIKVNGSYAIWGTRIVGLKSRTNFNSSGEGMGIDFKSFLKNLEGENEIPESVKIAEKIVKETNLLVATEIMDPILQIPFYQKRIPKEKLLLWNPAVNQLGWPVLIMSYFAKKNDWYIGLKNPKWLGDFKKKADSLSYKGRTSMEKTWEGLVSYANFFLDKEKIVLIHRGVDIPEKRNYRNAPLHNLASRVKRHTGCLLFFDPSHSYGPKMREKILPATLKAMKIKIDENEFLYDGILIEAGTSKTDSEQHISIKELKELVKELSKFRRVLGRG